MYGTGDEGIKSWQSGTTRTSRHHRAANCTRHIAKKIMFGNWNAIFFKTRDARRVFFLRAVYSCCGSQCNLDVCALVLVGVSTFLGLCLAVSALVSLYLFLAWLHFSFALFSGWLPLLPFVLQVAVFACFGLCFPFDSSFIG